MSLPILNRQSHAESGSDVEPCGSPSSEIAASSTCVLGEDCTTTERTSQCAILDADDTNTIHSSDSTVTGHSSGHLYLNGEVGRGGGAEATNPSSGTSAIICAGWKAASSVPPDVGSIAAVIGPAPSWLTYPKEAVSLRTEGIGKQQLPKSAESLKAYLVHVHVDDSISTNSRET